MMKTSLGHNRGFTLIELLVVVAIIGILSSIAGVLYMQYLDQAKKTVSLSALETMRQALESYTVDHGSYPITINFTTCVDQNSHSILPASSCEQLRKDVFAFDSYSSSGTAFSIKARAIDTKHSPLRVTINGTTLLPN